MRNRFFFIILGSLILGAIGITVTTSYFFRAQRISLIDQQISKSARVLLNSKEFAAVQNHITDLEDIISKVLSGDRIGKVFILRDENGKILYQSINVALLQADLPTTSDWITVEAGDQYVRIFNTSVGKKWTLQVGLVLDANFLNWRILNIKTTLFIVGIVLTLFAVAALLTLVLLSPIRLLNSHLSSATGDLKNLKDVDSLPKELMTFSKGYWARADEFSNLVNTVQKLINRINLNYKLTRSWTLQMAHELKTPLAILRAEVESHQENIPSDFKKALIGEVEWISETITDFLSWAELENSQPQMNLHVMRMGAVVQSVHARIDKLIPKRLEITISSDFSVSSAPGHLDQLVTNIVTNALKFSPPTSPVVVEVGDNELRVKDEGPGIPKDVLARLGQPFNVGFRNGEKIYGHGLGLAWVSTVTKLYGWILDIRTTSKGTEVVVTFPDID